MQCTQLPSLFCQISFLTLFLTFTYYRTTLRANFLARTRCIFRMLPSINLLALFQAKHSAWIVVVEKSSHSPHLSPPSASATVKIRLTFTTQVCTKLHATPVTFHGPEWSRIISGESFWALQAAITPRVHVPCHLAHHLHTTFFPGRVFQALWAAITPHAHLTLHLLHHLHTTLNVP